MIFVDSDVRWLFLLVGVIYFIIMYLKYRNSDARHTYETDTKTNMSNLRQVDRFVKTKKGLSNSIMEGANNTKINGNAGKGILDSMNGVNIKNSVVSALTDNNAVAGFIKDSIDKKDQNN